MSSSFSQTIAGGTQDLAALAGLFCTDGVERNALSVQAGYVAIAVSSLSLLGILGLVRSAVKVALGLRRCYNAGFNLDSLRSLYGYLDEEADPARGMIECDLIEVSFEKRLPVGNSNGTRIADMNARDNSYQDVFISKEKRWYDPQLTPIIHVGDDWPEKLWSKTAVNLGNLRRETSMQQSPWVIGCILFLCPGITAWLLLVVSKTWDWVTLVAIVGLHSSLSILLAIPLWHGRNMSQAGIYMTATVWKLLTEGAPSAKGDEAETLSFLQARVADGDVLHSSGNRKYLRSERVQSMVLIPASLCTVAYLCQYAILTRASNIQSLVWVGCQVLLALIRVLFWIWDPQFDNLSGKQTEYAIFNNTRFGAASLMEMMCACSSGLERTSIPKWVWEYLLKNDLAAILREATPDQLDINSLKVQESYALINIDFEHIVRQRLSRLDLAEREPPIWRLGMNRLEDDTIHPFVMIQMKHSACSSPTKANEGSWIESSWIRVVVDTGSLIQQDDKNEWIIRCPASLATFDQHGKQIHLHPFGSTKICPPDCLCANRNPITTNNRFYQEDTDSWKDLYDRGTRSCSHIREKIEGLEKGGQSVNVKGDGLWTVATPGITDRAGKVYPSHAEITRTWGNGPSGSMKNACKTVGEYIKKGIHDNCKSDGADTVTGAVELTDLSVV